MSKLSTVTEDQATAVYRFFDADGALLYVGLTCNPGKRWEQHSAEKLWWSDVAEVTVEQHPNRAAADHAETVAIQAENPRYNIRKRGTKGRRRRPIPYAVDDERRPYSQRRWRFRGLQYGCEWEVGLALYWEVNCSAMSDDWLPDEISAEGLLHRWRDKYAHKFEDGMASIHWFVESDPQGLFEAAPFMRDTWYASVGGTFQDFFSPPRDAQTGEQLDWLAVPVRDFQWNAERGDKGGFIQEATGWKPYPGQMTVPVVELLDRARVVAASWAT